MTYLTDIGNIDGYEYDGSKTYGAEIEEVKIIPKYYEVDETEYYLKPWLAEAAESTFMNNTKLLNEPPVTTYRDLRLSQYHNKNMKMQ